MLLMLLLAQKLTGAAILQDAWTKVDHAKAATVSMVRTSEEFKQNASSVSYAFRSGGYFRAKSGQVVDVSNPKQGWTFRADKKIYQVRTPVPTTFKLTSALGLGLIHQGMRTIGDPTPTRWHGWSTLRIELDGRQAMTKDTKLFIFVDPKTHLPIGISANLGSLTQVVEFVDFKLNPPIKDTVFQFAPPKGWKRVTADSGGWK